MNQRLHYVTTLVRGDNLRSIAALLAGIAVFCAPALAQSDQVKQGPAPAWVVPSDLLPVPADAGGLAFTRRQDVIIHIDRNGQQQYNGIRLKILHPNALQTGNIAITWNPAAGSPVVHAIKVYREAQAIDVLKTTAFEVLRREDQLEAARLDGQLTAVLRVPDLRVGDELEIAYTINAGDPTLGRNDAGALLLGAAPSPGRYRLELGWEKGMEPHLKMTPDMAAVAKRQGGMVRFQFDNPPMLSPPKDAPPRFQLQRLVQFSSFAEWTDVSRLFAPLFSQAAKLDANSPLKAEAARIAASYATPLERAGAALKLVQQNVRYVYVGLDRGNLTPATADDTWQRRYGDCKAKTALLLALLGELGVPAEAVLVNTAGADDGLNEQLPNPRAFDHVLVRIGVGGQVFWLDGTLPPVAPPAANPVFPLRWVLPISAQGSGLESITWQPLPRPDEISLFDIDARAGFDAPATVTSTSIVRGIKGLQEQLRFSSATPDQLQTFFRQQLVGSTWQTVESVKWRYDERAQASILAITGTWAMDWDNDGGKARSLALPGGGFSPPDRRTRSGEQDQNLPFSNKLGYECTVVTLRVPTSTRLDNWSTKSPYDVHYFGQNYYRVFDRRDGTIRMVRGFRVERPEVDPVSARSDNARIGTFDNSMAWVFYDPDTRVPLHPADKSVPMARELDWLGDMVPCLAANGSPKVATR